MSEWRGVLRVEWLAPQFLFFIPFILSLSTYKKSNIHFKFNFIYLSSQKDGWFQNMKLKYLSTAKN